MRKVQARIRLQRYARERDRSRRKLSGLRIRIVGADDCDLMTTPTQFLIQEPCLKDCTVGVRDPREVAQDGDAKRPTLPGRKRREGRRGLRHAAAPRPAFAGEQERETAFARPVSERRRPERLVKIVDITEFYSERGGGIRSHLTSRGHFLCQLGHDHTVIAPGPAG